MIALAWGGLADAVHAGGDSDLNLYLDNVVGGGGTADVALTFDNSLGPVAAWSVGVCHTSEVDIESVELGSTSATVLGGSPPAFEHTEVASGQGWSSGLVIDFLASFHLGIGTDYHLYTASYSILGAPGQTAALTFCGSELPLPVDTVISMQGGASLTPTTHPGSIEILVGSFHYTMTDMSVEYDLATGDASFAACATIREDSGNTDFPNAAVAFSMSVEHDPAMLTVTGISESGVIALLAGGAGPDFFGTHLLAGSGTLGCVFSYAMDTPIQFTTDLEVACFEYDTTGVLAGSDAGTTTMLEFASSGDPQVFNTVIVGVDEIPAIGHSGTITLETDGAGDFIRGDGNGDGAVNVADVVFNLDYLFQGGSSNCLKAHDDNDDGTVNIADPVFSLTFQFQFGPIIPSPYPSCGSDPTSDELTCDLAIGCP